MGVRIPISVNPCKGGVRIRYLGGPEIAVCKSREELVRKLAGCGYFGDSGEDIANRAWTKYIESVAL